MTCVPAHNKVAGNEQADSYAKAVASRSALHNDNDDVPDGLPTEASLSHMSRSATEARSRATAEWIDSHVHSTRRYRPPPGRGLRRQHLSNTKKELAGRYYQFLSGHGAIRSFLSGHGAIRPHLKRMKKVDSDRRWFRNTGKRQSRFRLVARCPA